MSRGAPESLSSPTPRTRVSAAILAEKKREGFLGELFDF